MPFQLIKCFFLTILFSLNLLAAPLSVYIIQIPDYYEIGGAALDAGDGDMARLHSYIEDIRSKHQNVIVVHVGDFVEPSVLNTVNFKGEELRAKATLEVMSKLGIDYIVPGNHDFKYGKEYLEKEVFPLGPKFLSTNIRDENGKVLPELKEFSVEQFGKENDSIKIAFTGVTVETPVKALQFSEPVGALARTLKNLEDSADIVIPITHLNAETDQKILDAFPQIPLSLGGHDHDRMTLTSKSGSKHYKANATREVVLHKLTIDSETKQVQEIESKFVPIDKGIPRHKESAVIIDKYLEMFFSYYKSQGIDVYRKIGYFHFPVNTQVNVVRKKPTTIVQYAAKGFAEYTGAPYALFGGGTLRSEEVYEAGDIYYLHVIKMIPVDKKVYVIDVPGKILKSYINNERWITDTVYYNLYGVEKDGILAATELEDAKLYRVAMNGTNYQKIKSLRETPVISVHESTREALVLGLSQFPKNPVCRESI